VKRPLEIAVWPKIQLKKFLAERRYWDAFAAQSANFALLCLSLGVTGKMETSISVSTRYLNSKLRSVMNSRR